MWAFFKGLLDLKDLASFVQRHGEVRAGPAVVTFGLVCCGIATCQAYEDEGGDLPWVRSPPTVEVHPPNAAYNVEVHAGAAALFQTALSQGCAVTCRVGSAVVWSRADGECVGTTTQQQFLSEDCEDVVLVTSTAVKRFVRGVKVPDESLNALRTAHSWVRDGDVLRAVLDGKPVEAPLHPR